MRPTVEVEIMAKPKPDATPAMGSVRFLVDREVQDHTGKIVKSFKAGEVYQLRDDVCDRWVRRQAAVRVDGSSQPSAAVTQKSGAAPATVRSSKATITVDEATAKARVDELGPDAED